MDKDVNSRRKVCALDAKVVRIDHPCREHVRIEMTAEGFPPSQPGQFLQVLAHAPEQDAPRTVDWNDDAFPAPSIPDWQGLDAFLRRPFSIADRWEDNADRAHLCLISRAIGAGTRWLDQLQTGQTLNITGPLGRGFELPQNDTHCVLIGGGVGIPPLLYLTRRLAQHAYPNVDVILGAMSRDLFPVALTAEPDPHGHSQPCVELPTNASYPAIVTTNDGSLGMRGLVTDALRTWIASRPDRPERACVFACGPERMLHAVANLTRELGLECQLCIERMMGCGMGTCLSCITPVHDPSRPTGWRWALACGEGPVFTRDRLMDYRPA